MKTGSAWGNKVRKAAWGATCAAVVMGAPGAWGQAGGGSEGRTRVSIDDNWRFSKGDPAGAVGLQYDARPAGGRRGGGPAVVPDTTTSMVLEAASETEPATAPTPVSSGFAKAWILPTGNGFLKEAAKGAVRPVANLGEGLAYLAPGFDDRGWKLLDLPHDYAIEEPFTTAGGGGMGRLPTAGASWYRKELTVPAAAADKVVFVDFDGAMAYSEVWCNGKFVGGWPFGYASFRLNLTPYVKAGERNVLAVRLDNLPTSSRWYPGAGIYRHVWMVTTNKVHVGQWGTYVTTPEVSAAAATVVVKVTVDNAGSQEAGVSVGTQIFALDGTGQRTGEAVATLQAATASVAAGKSATVEVRGNVADPKLWSTKTPNRYVAVTTVSQNGTVVDTYETPFGIRTLKFDADKGFFLNGEHVKINGVCNHHDLGALGAALNDRALQRQLEILAEMGCNAIRTSHNPPAPELLDLCDKMGFLVMDESYDCWARQKTANDYHLLWADWHEQDQRALIRRDRNHPSVIIWGIGNEVGEQSGDSSGIAWELTQICHEEDPTRPTSAAMNSARANSPFAGPIDLAGLNYQGAGLNPALRPPGTPQYPLYHEAYPEKFIFESESASTVSSRGFYTFPVAPGLGTAAARNAGELPGVRQVSSYDMYHADWAMVPDKEFAAQERWPFIGGEFVWTGFDYLGEPTPFDASRSSYFGIIDLAGFKKDRFYLYQSVWRPELPMAHILPHWNWAERAGEVTPVHVYTSGEEAELFLNGKSLGRKKKGEYEYRLRWDDVMYEPGELRVVTYKAGKQWATDVVKTTGEASKLVLTADRAMIAGDGKDLSFVTLTVADKDGLMVPKSMHEIHFGVSGPGEIVATDNGDPTDMTAFPSKDRKAFNGLALAIVRAKKGQSGTIVVTARAEGLTEAQVTIAAK